MYRAKLRYGCISGVQCLYVAEMKEFEDANRHLKKMHVDAQMRDD
jgi:hypothetical protein